MTMTASKHFNWRWSRSDNQPAITASCTLGAVRLQKGVKLRENLVQRPLQARQVLRRSACSSSPWAGHLARQ